MTALTEDLTRQNKLGSMEGERTLHLPTQGFTDATAAYTIYKGAIVATHATGTVGYFKPNAGSAAPTTSVFGGIAMGRQSITADALGNGDVEVNVLTKGIIGFPVASFTQADVGKNMFATTDNDITLAPLLGLWIGTIEEVRDGQVWVNIEPAAMQLSAPTTLV